MYIDDHVFNGHDYGSIVCVGFVIDRVSGDKQVREYRGLATDFSKLPTYPDLATGSSFLATDTLQISFYNASTKTWSTLS